MTVTVQEIVEALRSIGLFYKRKEYMFLADRIEREGIALEHTQSTEQIMSEYPCDWGNIEYLLKCAERYGSVTEPTHLHLLAVALANKLEDEILVSQTLPAVLKKVYRGLPPPEGWVLVPVEPTAKMMEVVKPKSLAYSIYKSMLAAAKEST